MHSGPLSLSGSANNHTYQRNKPVIVFERKERKFGLEFKVRSYELFSTLYAALEKVPQDEHTYGQTLITRQ